MLNLHYDKISGDVKSYQEGPNPTEAEDIPDGCDLLVVTSSMGMFDMVSGLILYKVDPVAKQLISLKAPQVIDYSA